MDANSVELYAIVSGKVQGVGFRYTTCQLALQLRLRGTVRNCADGSVEIIAQGTREQVDAFMTQLKGIPRLGRIDAMEVHYRHPQSFAESFQIID